MKIFITGGTGFIGKPVVDKLKSQDHSLLLLSRSAKTKLDSQIKIINGDLGNIPKWQNNLKKFTPDAAIHIAWEGLHDQSAQVSKLNLEYGLNLTEVLAEVGCKKMITTGSCWEYGIQSGKLSENTPPIPFNAYNASKNALHWLGREIAKEVDMEFIWTRLFYVYGPGQDPRSLIPHILSSAKQGKQPEIRNPEGQNDFIFVEDVADALCKILKKSSERDVTSTKNSVYNIASGKLTSVSYIVNLVLEKYGIKSDFKKIKALPKDGFSYAYADISKIKKEVGWKPTTSIEEGIQKTINENL